MYAVAPTNKTVANPDKPFKAAPTIKTYTDQSKYITNRVMTISRQAPIMATSKAGFLLPPLSVHGPQSGATTRESRVRTRL